MSAVAEEYRRAEVAGDATPWRLAHFCVVDLELSGLDPRRDEIISFGAVPIDAGRVVVGNALYGLCRPRRPLRQDSVLVHGIRTVDLAEAAPIDDAVQPLIAIMTGRVLVAHFASIEKSFLGPVFRRQGLRLHHPVLDTRDLGHLLALEKGQPSPKPALGEIAERLNLPVHRPHNALGDALTTAQVFIALATLLDQYEPQTVRSLSLADQRARTLSMYPTVTEG